MAGRGLAKSAYAAVLRSLPAKIAISMDYFLRHNRIPNLENPQTFTEKIQYRKLYERDARLPMLADKQLVKEHVAKILGPEWVIPTIWYGNGLPAREHRNWPLPYVLKATHGSGQNYFATSPEQQDWEKMEAKVAEWLDRKHAAQFYEWLYSEIHPRLLVEPYLGGLDELPLDYKFLVFGGKVRYIQVDTGRKTAHRRCFYDSHWNRQQFALGYPLETSDVPVPGELDRMIQAAELLGNGFTFIRVDMYEIENKPLFGELTFYPDSGREVFSPKDYDLKLGQLWP